MLRKGFSNDRNRGSRKKSVLGDLSDVAAALERIDEQENQLDLLKLELKQVNSDLDSERMLS